MSYIRCLSNPEGLYIYDIAGGKIQISLGQNEFPYQLPRHVFHALLKRYLQQQDEEDFRYRGGKLTILEDFRWRLSYKDWHVDLWDTTLYYIARSNAQEFMTAKEMKDTR